MYAIAPFAGIWKVWDLKARSERATTSLCATPASTHLETSMNWCRIEVVAAALKQCGARTRGFHLAGSVYGIANSRITAQVKPLFPFATSTYPVGVRKRTVAESLTCFGAAVRASATSAARSESMNLATSFPWAARRAGARVSVIDSRADEVRIGTFLN